MEIPNLPFPFLRLHAGKLPVDRGLDALQFAFGQLRGRHRPIGEAFARAGELLLEGFSQKRLEGEATAGRRRLDVPEQAVWNLHRRLHMSRLP